MKERIVRLVLKDQDGLDVNTILPNESTDPPRKDSILSFEQPPKTKNPDMLYPYELNMPEEYYDLFRAKHVTGKDERVEIRTSRFGCEARIVVYKDPNPPKYQCFGNDSHLDVRISANGKMHFTFGMLAELRAAIQEARAILGNS